MDLMQADKVLVITPPAAIVDNASLATTEIDTVQDGVKYEAARIFVILGATDIAMTALKLTQSDTAGSGHADITASVYGTANGINGSASALPSATDDNKVFAWEIPNLTAYKRYLDVVATIGDGAAGGFTAIIVLLYRAKKAPQTAAERGFGNIIRL